MVGVSNDTTLDIPIIKIDAFVQKLPKPFADANPLWGLSIPMGSAVFHREIMSLYTTRPG